MPCEAENASSLTAENAAGHACRDSLEWGTALGHTSHLIDLYQMQKVLGVKLMYLTDVTISGLRCGALEVCHLNLHFPSMVSHSRCTCTSGSFHRLCPHQGESTEGKKKMK